MREADAPPSQTRSLRQSRLRQSQPLQSATEEKKRRIVRDTLKKNCGVVPSTSAATSHAMNIPYYSTSAAEQPSVFVPGTDASKPLGAPQWTKLVKAVFKKHTGVALAPKELRSSFITFLRSGDNSDAALKSAAFAMRHSSAQARGPAYDKERAERLSAAAVQVAGSYAARFK